MNRFSDYTVGNHHRTSPGVTKVINKHRPQVCHSYGNRNEKTSPSWFTKVAFLRGSVAVHKFRLMLAIIFQKIYTGLSSSGSQVWSFPEEASQEQNISSFSILLFAPGSDFF